jgi:cytidylate kinase
VSPRVVAIDGPAGSGKSTLARSLARVLGLPYVNTGSMYRALTMEALRRGVNLDDGSALASLMDTLEFSVSRGSPGELWIDGRPAGPELESGEVESTVSAVARHPQVRARMRDAQRQLGGGGAVMEGRDIGTVVFPDAPVKVFLEADPHRRAGRRELERDVDDAVGALHERDRLDAGVNPFVPAPDAVVIDTSDLGIEDTVRAALVVVADRAPELLP